MAFGRCHDSVENGEGMQSAQARIGPQILGDDRVGLDHLIREWKPDGVEPQLPDAREDGIKGPSVKPSRHEEEVLHAEPVDRRDTYRTATRINDAIAARVPVAGRARRCRLPE